MAVHNTGKLTITYNGADLARYLVDEADAMIDNFVRTIDVDVTDWRTMPPTVTADEVERINETLSNYVGEYTFNLTFVRVRSAPIHACLWRRNLDGGAWRKRGHAAHRG